jgi:hypothetical protein
LVRSLLLLLLSICPVADWSCVLRLALCRDAAGDNKSKDSAKKKLCGDFVALLKSPFGKSMSAEQKQSLIKT